MSPLMWIIHLNRLAEETRNNMCRQFPSEEMEINFMIQIFADDISVAIGHGDRQMLIKIAWRLREVLHKLLKQLDLEESLPKCNNFIVDILVEAGVSVCKKYLRPSFRKIKEQKRQRMLRDVDRLECEEQMGRKQEDLPYPWKYSFRLLGMVIDCHWVFEEHIRDMRSRAVKRLAVLGRVANTNWGLENRILSITTHSLVESLINYGSAVYGSHCGREQGEKIDSMILNKAARKVTGTGFATRREILHILADTRSFDNHYNLKAANIVDRALRADGTNAQKNVINLSNQQRDFQTYNKGEMENFKWKKIMSKKEG